MSRPWDKIPVHSSAQLENAEIFLRVRDLLTPGHDPEDMVAIIEQWAASIPGCQRARLLLSPSAPLEADEIGISLCAGGARLALSLDSPTVTPRSVTDLSWFELLELRLSELLVLRDLQASVETARRAERIQKALFAIGDLAHSELALHDMLQRVHAIVCDLTYAENFYIALYSEENDTLRFAYDADLKDAQISRSGDEVRAADFPNSLTFAVVHGRRSLMGPSLQLRRQLQLGDDIRLGPDCVDWLGVPMLEGDRARGAVVVQSYDPARRYSEDDHALLLFVAQHILTAVKRKQAQEELEQAVAVRTTELAEANQVLRAEGIERERGQRLQAALFRIAELASERGSLDDFFTGVHRAVAGLLDARNFFIALLSDDGDALSFPYFVDELDKPLATRRLTHGITELVLRNRQPLLATAPEIRALMAAGQLLVFGTVPACWLGLPLLLGERAVGAMVVQCYESELAYGRQEQEILQFASLHIATALERRQTQERLRLAHADLERRVLERTRELRLANDGLREQIHVREMVESQLKHEALHDALTGLPNRTALLGNLEHALVKHKTDPTRLFAVLFLDLDRFKVVNDSVGHLAGDELLIEAGQRITRCVAVPGAVARLGGDEFTVLLEDLGNINEACLVAERILRTLIDPVKIGEKEIYTSASIGIAIAHPRYQRAEELLRDADVAMYRAKARGRRRYELFDQQLHEQALRMLDLESGLRRAIERKEFEPYLQPIVELANGHVLGYEALLRWRHDGRGLLLPADFLSVAEESGNIEHIDWQIYEQVLRMIPRLDRIDAYVSINVSARHFRSPELVANLLELIEAYKVPTWRLRIEVTEGALLENPDQAGAAMQHFRDAGVLTSLDDFGTGYSSLSYLHRFPLHTLKIDRSFVLDLHTAASSSSVPVVRAIRAMAESLGMEVIAEGIETAGQRETLLRLECAMGQGFLFAEPRPFAHWRSTSAPAG